MAKVIWWLAIIIVALVNRVLPYHMEEIPFVEGKYYGQDLVGVDDPTAIYNSFFAPQTEFYEPCIAQNMSSSYHGTQCAMLSSPHKTYFLLKSDKTVTTDDELKSYCIPADKVTPVVAPLNCTIETPLANSANSTYMKIYIPATQEYVIFSNLDHWYCCHGHTRKSPSGFKHFNVTDSDFENRVIKQGEILGFANADTIVTITDKDGNELSFDQFFLGADTLTFTTNLSAINRSNETLTSVQ